jgi:hypothetical protein
MRSAACAGLVSSKEPRPTSTAYQIGSCNSKDASPLLDCLPDSVLLQHLLPLLTKEERASLRCAFLHRRAAALLLVFSQCMYV